MRKGSARATMKSMGSDSSDVRRDLLPAGDAVQRAVRWIGQRRLDQPTQALGPIIDEASLQFDLSPLQAEALIRLLTGAP